MIAALAAFWIFALPAAGERPPCPDWRGLAQVASLQGYNESPSLEVAVSFRRAAEAAECSGEPVETSDLLWRRSIDWMGYREPEKAVRLIEERLRAIRAAQGGRDRREVKFLWLEAKILGHERSEPKRAERDLMRALEIQRELYGDASVEVATAYRQFAYFYSDVQRVQDALKVAELAIESAERSGVAGRGELHEALALKYSILGSLQVNPAERDHLSARLAGLWQELQAEGWQQPEDLF
jgi:tetratricopeptide (TPR) repeat protein